MSGLLAEIIQSIPVATRKKTAERGGFKLNDDERYTCKDGMCVMAALVTDIAGSQVAGSLPSSMTIAETLRDLDFPVPDLETAAYGTLLNEIWNLMRDNDNGRLVHKTKARKALYLD